MKNLYYICKQETLYNKKISNMKKIFIFSIFAICASTFIACSSCKNEKKNVNNDTIPTTMVVENIISTDREDMFNNVSQDYRWFETCVLLPEFLDSENVTSTPAMVVNVFQSVVERGNGFDTWVWKFQHFPDGTVITDSINGFWIEDCELNEEVFKLTYTEAFDRMMQANFPKPHSKNAILTLLMVYFFKTPIIYIASIDFNKLDNIYIIYLSFIKI